MNSTLAYWMLVPHFERLVNQINILRDLIWRKINWLITLLVDQTFSSLEHGISVGPRLGSGNLTEFD